MTVDALLNSDTESMFLHRDISTGATSVEEWDFGPPNSPGTLHSDSDSDMEGVQEESERRGPTSRFGGYGSVAFRFAGITGTCLEFE